MAIECAGLLAAMVGAAWSATLGATPVDGPLRPAQPAVVEVLLPEGVPDSLHVEGVLAWSRMERGSPSLILLRVVPDPEAPSVSITNQGEGEVLEVSFPIELPEISPLELAVSPLVDGRARIEVTGPNLHSSDTLRVVVGEGAVVMDAEAGGHAFTVEIDPSPYPRSVPVGVDRVGAGHPPVWTEIPVWASPSIPLEVEPGATVSLEVGSRQYGPWEAGLSGSVLARIDQGPRDRFAQAVFADALGNTIRSRVPLAVRTQPWIVGMVQAAAGGATPSDVLVLRVDDGAGRALGGPPRCVRNDRMLVAGGRLRGAWWIPLGEREIGTSKVVCDVGGVKSTFYVPGESPRPSAVDLKVWPSTISAAEPKAHVDLRLLDQWGAPLDVAGVFEFEADHGRWVEESLGQGAARVQWSSEAKGLPGAVTMRARWFPDMGVGTPGGLYVGLEAGGLHVTVTDARARPLADAPVRVIVEGDVKEVRAGELGTVRVPVESWGSGGLEVRVESGAHVRSHLFVPDEGHPAMDARGTVEVDERIEVRGGPVHAIRLTVQPPMLRAGPGSRATIEVLLEDKDGRRIEAEEVLVMASEGVVGPVRRSSSGTWVATWEPSLEGDERQVEIVAEADGQRTSTLVHVQDQPVQWALGPWVGFRVAPGGLVSPSGELNLDVRTKWMDESVLARVGVGAWLLTSDTRLDGESVALRGFVAPLMASVLLRRDLRDFAVWGGGGGWIGLYGSSLHIDGDLTARSLKAGGGPVMVLGMGWTKAQGELALEVHGSWFQAEAEESGFAGNLGGISPGVSYRLVY
jgi:hypothetical protein